MSAVLEHKPPAGDTSSEAGPGTNVQHQDTNHHGSADTPPIQPSVVPFDVEDAAATAAAPDSGPERLYMTGWRLYVLTFASVLPTFPPVSDTSREHTDLPA